jgi:hypothetical protein
MENVGGDFFSSFNSGGMLTSLPAGSFSFPRIKFVDYGFFSEFNGQGALISLPEGSFGLEGITSTRAFFFEGFNYQGALTSLPEGSFDTSNIVNSFGSGFFEEFNHQGELTSLPEGSFDTSKMIDIQGDFFRQFNHLGAITYLPSSFKWPSDVDPATDEAFMHAFNSPGATLNVNVADLVSNIETPDQMRWTFSSNQPGWDQLPVYWRAD